MSGFQKYMHLERLGTSEVDGITVGTCYVFPKLDGTNASVWLGEDGKIHAGSRNRELSEGADNAGFYNAITKSAAIKVYLQEFPHHILYGEWLVPHTLKTYREDAWRRFYVFDVFCKKTQRMLPYEEYKGALVDYGLDFIVPMAIIKNGTPDQFQEQIQKNVYYVTEGIGEGIVIKNYDFVNRYGRTIWAKLIATQFKEQHHAAMGAPVIESDFVEDRIVNKYVTKELVDKCHAKIVNEHSGEWSSRMIPQLLGMVFYDLVKEETWEFMKAFKHPTINFKHLQHFCNVKVKEHKKELF